MREGPWTQPLIIVVLAAAFAGMTVFASGLLAYNRELRTELGAKVEACRTQNDEHGALIARVASRQDWVIQELMRLRDEVAQLRNAPRR